MLTARLLSGGARAWHRGLREVSAAPVSPWSLGEPGPAQGQWVRSRCHRLRWYLPSSAGAGGETLAQGQEQEGQK